jgi:hypothetical protein
MNTNEHQRGSTSKRKEYQSTTRRHEDYQSSARYHVLVMPRAVFISRRVLRSFVEEKQNHDDETDSYIAPSRTK